MNVTRDQHVTGETCRQVIALDGGTTNTRARLIQDGRIVVTARREIGVRDTVLTDRAALQRLAVAVKEAIIEAGSGMSSTARNDGMPDHVDLIVASGMLTSEVGLVAVPHVDAPAGLDELADAVVTRTLPDICAQPIHFVPGLRTQPGDGPAGWMCADVMRGEECETLGALAELKRTGAVSGKDALAFIWPGSHTKLVELDVAGKIRRSQTTLAGELLRAVAQHTLIAASLPRALPDRLDPVAAEAGAQAGREQGLQRAAFLVRLAALRQAMSQDERAAFWIGAVIGDDVAHLIRHPILGQRQPVFVGGREPLRTWYARLLDRFHDGPVTALDNLVAEGASALGALAIVLHRIGSKRFGDGSSFAEPAP